jgi:hypothetical protein
MVNEIVIRNVGPIEQLVIPVRPGIVYLEGENGSGKSTALRAIGALSGGEKDLELRDGARSGLVEAPGVRIVLGARVTRTGTLSVSSLDGAIDPSVLIDPGFETGERNDLERAKVLCQLAGVEASIELFTPIMEALGCDVEPSLKTRDAKSLPEMAMLLKRDLELRARELETKRDAEKNKAEGLETRPADVDVDGEAHELTLLARLESAMNVRAQTVAERTSAIERRARHNANVAKLAECKESALAVEAAERRLADDRKAQDAAAAVLQSRREVAALAAKLADDASSALAKAQKASDAANAEYAEAGRAVDQATTVADESERALARARDAAREAIELREIIAAGAGDPGPGEEDVAAASEAVTRAQQACSAGATIRDWRKRVAAAVAHRDHAGALEGEAVLVREAARSVWNVVAEQVASVNPEGLQMSDGRIWLTTDRGEELFSDLSPGERAKIAWRAAMTKVGSGGILHLSQEACESMNPANRQELSELAAANGVCIITALPTDGPLRVETAQ